MKKKTGSVLLYSLLAISYGFTQTNPQIDSLILSHINKGFNGNIIYTKNDTIVFTENYGLANFATKEQLTDSSLFELGSVSKQFTAIAIITLIEAGKLTYETDVSEIIEGFPYKGITVEHLLQHRSGLPEFYTFAIKHKIWKEKERGMVTNKDLLTALTHYQPDLNFQPGTDHEYSNLGYVLLAVIIEKVSGQTYAGYIKQHLFLPAGMLTSDVILREYNPEKIRNNTEGYANIRKNKKATEKRTWIGSFKDGIYYSNINYNLNGIYGHSGVSSSVSEMELWKQALRYNKIISEESKQRMADILLKSGKLGYGFLVMKDSHGVYFYHPGLWSGYTAESLYYPETNEYIVVLSNNGYKHTGAIAGKIIGLQEE